ncbi:MAG: SDR family oxidoreductase [Bacteroidota bacterium]
MAFDPLFNLGGKVAVITGGSGILCSAIARAYADRGVRVALLGRTLARLESIAAVITASGGEVLVLQADVLDQPALGIARARVLDMWGQIDILINGAGGNIPGGTVGPQENFFDHHAFENFKQVLDLNLDGTVLPSMVFGRAMAARKQGVILNISSMSATRAITRVAGYSTAKSGIEAFTRWLAVEAALKFGEGIRVNAISPGFFITEQNRALLTHPDGTLTERGGHVVRNTPLRRFGVPDELIGTCIWLCSDASRFVTGAVIPVDGGFSAWTGV